MSPESGERETDLLDELGAVAREVLERPRRLEPCWGHCSLAQRLGAFTIDLLLGGVFAFVALIILAILDYDGSPARSAIGDALFLFAGACLPLLYSALDGLPGNTPGKRMAGIRIDAPPPAHWALAKRWLAKGLPLLLVVPVSLLGLAQAEFEPGPGLSHPNYFNAAGVYLLIGGYVWWLVASIVTFGELRQTVPDLVAGTWGVTQRALPEQRGFEPIVRMATVSTLAERPSPPPSPTGV
jgi:uncharacterized RDD family membrane protein YckC